MRWLRRGSSPIYHIPGKPIFDRAEAEGKISKTLWLLFKNQLREIVFLEEGDPERLQFGNATLYKVVKLISCENEESKNDLVITVHFRELWKGSELAAVLLKEIPCRKILPAKEIPAGKYCQPPLSVDPIRVLKKYLGSNIAIYRRTNGD